MHKRSRILNDKHSLLISVTEAVIDFLRALPKSQGKVLPLAAFGMKYEEIAQRTGTSLGTVRSRLHYARKKAQAELAHCR